MMLSAYPDMLNYQRQTRMTSDIKARLEVTSREAVTGRRDDITAAVGGNVGGVHLLEKALADITQHERINAISSARIDLTSSSLSSIRSVMDGISTTGIIAVSGGDEFKLEVVTKQAEANLRSMMSILGTSHGNRKLFSGDATDQSPLASPETLLADVKAIIQTGPDSASIKTALDTYFDDPAGGFATSIYQGGTSDAPPSFLADGSKIDFSIRADNQALKDAMRGLAIMATAIDSGYDIGSNTFKDVFTQGTTAAGKANANIIKLEGQAGIYSSMIEDSNTRQSAERLTLSQALVALTGRDQYDAVAELKQLETQLEASYLITNRLSKLNLTNFIR